MSDYLGPILWGILIFPFIAALFTIPYVLSQYHKYGSIPFLRVIIVYSFILYLICAYFLVILPLPSIDEVAKLTTPTMQLHPFEFVLDFMSHTSLVISEPSTYLKAITEPWFYQVIYNILLFVPFGIYLRYYFKCSLKKTILLSFLLSLLFELTQLSGLYGIYPRGYRLFDVDDLIINTLGGLVGFLFGGLALKILPSRDELDSHAYKKGQEISGLRRLVSFCLDLFLWFILTGFIASVCQFFFNGTLKYTPYIAFAVYYFVIPIILKGQTLGKKFLNMKIVNLDENKPKFYQYFLRYVLLFFVVLPFPIYLGVLLVSLNKVLTGDIFDLVISIMLLVVTIGMFIYYFKIFISMTKGKLIWYERLTKTKNISTIEFLDEEKESKKEEDTHKSE